MALVLGGCITPPVVAEAHNEDWTLESSGYPDEAAVVEVRGASEGDPVLRGLFVPSDRGAPVVVHYAESGGSITQSMHRRGQYAALAELGFASLAIDYRGVGLSDGDPSPRRLGDDAFAIWKHALGLAGGDASRVLVRGTSLGTVAATSLLARGVEPAAVIAFAPVRPVTVATRYGYAVFWDAFVWLASPFLATFLDADPLEWLTREGVPRLVVASPEDELLGERDFERLRAGVEASGGTCDVPESLFVMILGDDPVMEALGKHIALTRESYGVGRGEREFLVDVFDDVPDMDQRLDRVRRIGPALGVAAVWSDGDALDRLRIPLSQHRKVPASVALTAAMLFTAEEMQSFGGWFKERYGHRYHERIATLPFSELGELLDLDDPGGRLPIGMITAARAVLGDDEDARGRPRWSAERVDALASSLLGVPVPGRVFERGGRELVEGEDWRFGVREEDRVPLAFTRGGQGFSGSLYVGGFMEVFEEDSQGRTPEEAERRLRRSLAKAAGFLD